MSGELGLQSSVVALWAAPRTVRAICDDGAVIEGRGRLMAATHSAPSNRRGQPARALARCRVPAHPHRRHRRRCTSRSRSPWSEAARRLGVGSALVGALVGLAWAAAGVALFFGRARAVMPDRSAATASWCASSTSRTSSTGARRCGPSSRPVVETLVLPLVDLARGVPGPTSRWARTCGRTSRGSSVSAYGILVRRRWVRVVEREVRLPGLDAKLDGLRVAQLSDLHVGALTPKSWAHGMGTRREPPRARSRRRHRGHGHERHGVPRGHRGGGRLAAGERSASSCRWATTTTSARASRSCRS